MSALKGIETKTETSRQSLLIIGSNTVSALKGIETFVAERVVKFRQGSNTVSALKGIETLNFGFWRRDVNGGFKHSVSPERD